MRSLRFSASLIAAAVLTLTASSAFAGDGASLLRLLPDSANAVVTVNVERLRGTPVFERGMALVNSSEDAQSQLATIRAEGFDPFQAANTIVVAATEVSDDAADRMLVLVEATYPREALAARLTNESYEQSEIGGAAVYRKSQSTVAMLSDSLLAIGHFDLVSAAANAHAGQGGGLSAALAAQASSVDKTKTIWFVANLPEGSNGAEVARASIDLASGFALAASVTMDTAENASSNATEMTTQVAAVAGSPEVAALGLAPLLQGLTATANGSELQVAVSVDANAWAGIVAAIGELVEEELR